jgi:AraC-like DNA-binding protein
MIGIGRHQPCDSLPRHRHSEGYAALVLVGGYSEAGDAGRVRVTAGDAVIHGAFQAHRNDFGGAGAIVLNLPLVAPLSPGARRVRDVDAIARRALCDPIEAAAMLAESAAVTLAPQDDWPDQLARALARDPALCLRAWAERLGIAPQSLSRGFRQVYGVSPKCFRAEQRALRAVETLRGGGGRLADLAADLGFADQAHLTRAVTTLTGCSPARLRVQSVQESARPLR